jgi:NAD(P)-dependent dehydrogenase (short-subunit alcohol dehydrogenase family)
MTGLSLRSYSPETLAEQQEVGVGRLQDKVAIVVGAGSIGPGWGNGKATAVLFAREGAKVLAVDINRAAAEETCQIIRGEGGACEVFEADVTRASQVSSMAEACLERFGRVDVLQNNVGIAVIGGPVELAEEDWDRIHDVNLKSFFLTCKEVLPHMERQGSGSIVNVSSIASIRWTGVPYISYYTSKAAINQLTQAVAMQYAARGVRCNAVLPGLMDTPLIRVGLADFYAEGDVDRMIELRDAQCPTGRMGDAWDVAHASLFLASDEARYVTGHCLVVDGGLSCKCT